MVVKPQGRKRLQVPALAAASTSVSCESCSWALTALMIVSNGAIALATSSIGDVRSKTRISTPRSLIF